MRATTLAGALAASLLLPAGAARAQGDETMPLSQVRPGMECKGYSVFRGTQVADFDVEIVDVVGGEGGARLLVRVSGPNVDQTGVGAGFSGSPIYCRGDDRRFKNVGAISETIGEYGGKTVLATPIEQILSTEVDPPPDDEAKAGPPSRRSLAGPLTIRGLSSPLFRALSAAAQRYGRTILQAPPVSLSAQAAPNPLIPGSAVSVGLSSGDVSVGAVGTVAYVDGDKVWSFGHSFEGVGRRSLFLQSAYVAAIVSNPVQLHEAGGTYKLAGALHDLGTATNDAVPAVAGRVGPLPPSVPVRVYVHDEPSGESTFTEVQVADETDVGMPAGSTPLSFVAPLAISQAATDIYDAAPVRLAGTMCLRITLRERRKPIRICNRYVSDGTEPTIGAHVVALRAGADAADVLAQLDTYKAAGLHVTEVAARIRMRRGQHQAFLRSVGLPRRVRPGQRVTVRARVRRVRGRAQTLRLKMRVPRTLGRGNRRLVFKGTDADPIEDLFETLILDFGGDGDEDTTGPTSIAALVREMRKVESWDGVKVNKRRAFRHPRLRIGGRAEALVTVR